MTMRLDIVSNDAGESVRRERARELGADVVVELYKVVKLVTMHELGNEAMVRQRDQTYQAIQEYCLKSGLPVSILFAHKAVFVGGQLLRGSRSVYDAALELGMALERLGGAEVTITRDLTREDLNALVEAFAQAFRTNKSVFRSPTPRFRLRPVNAAARLRGLELEELSPDERIVRTYASAVVILRRFYEDLGRSRYVMPRRIKRVAQGLVDLSFGNTPAFLGVTEVRNANEDEAGRAVNASILAVAMARELTEDRTLLAQIAVAAMMYGVGRPRALAMGSGDGRLVEALSEDQEDRLPAGSAAVLTALGRVNEPTITRTVIAFEAQWLRRKFTLGDLYGGIRAPTVQAKLVHIARMYNDAMLPEPGLPPKHPDRAIAELVRSAPNEAERSLIRLLASALGLLPAGTVLKLASGEIAEVLFNAAPSSAARVRIVMDRRGAVVDGPEVELGKDPSRAAVKVVSVEGWTKILEIADEFEGYPSEPPAALVPLDEDVAVRGSSPSFGSGAAHSAQSQTGQRLRGAASEAPAAPDSAPPASVDEGSLPSIGSMDSLGSINSVNSMNSLGTSPSQVVHAMGFDLLAAGTRRSSDSAAMRVNPVIEEADLGDVDGVQHTQISRPNLAGRPSSNWPMPDVRSISDLPPKNANVELEPAARGSLETTPLAHVLVYMLEHALSGTVTFHGGGLGVHNVYFERGIPAQARIGMPSMPLGELLAASGKLEPQRIAEYVQDARKIGLLFGEYLVGEQIIERTELESALAQQLAHRVTSLANLPSATTYAYYADINMADGHTQGAELVSVSPLRLVLDVVLAWRDATRVAATLTRIRALPLVLHPEANLEALALSSDEAEIVESILRASCTPDEIVAQSKLPVQLCTSVLYALAVTRQFALPGQSSTPMFPRATPLTPAHALQLLARGRSRTASAARAAIPIEQPRPNPASSGSLRAVAGREPLASQPITATSVRAGAGSSPSVSPAGSTSGAPKRPMIRQVGAAGPRSAVLPVAAAPPSASRIVAAPAKPPPAEPVHNAPTSAPPSAPASSGALHAADESHTMASNPNILRELLRRTSVPASRAADAPPSVRQMTMPKAADAPPSSRHLPAPSAPASSARASSNPLPPDDVDVDWSALGDDVAERAMEAMTYHRRAEALLAKGNLEQALEYAQQAVAGDPDQGDYRALEVWLEWSLERVSSDSAIDTWSAVLASEPTCTSARLFRARLYASEGIAAAARDDFKAILDEDPNHAEARRELRKLG